MEVRNEVNKSEERLLKITGPLSRIAAYIKRIKHPDYFLRLSEIIEIGADEYELYSVAHLLNKRVTQICRAGSRFSKGCLCVSLYGDSDQVLRWAIKHGAIAVVTDKEIYGIPCIVVPNPYLFYSKVCGYFRMLSPVSITAVAGSIGKTTTKRMITSVYQEQFKTFNDPENENQIDCVGYICQHIPKGIEMQVQEVSEDTPGCMKYMSEMLRPDVVVITAIDESHIEEFGSKDGIYQEVCSIISNMAPDGIIIIDYEDQRLYNYLPENGVVTVSLNNQNATYYAKSITVDKDGLHFLINDSVSGQKYNIFLRNIFAKHNVISALYAFAAGRCYNETPENIINGLENYKTLGIRQNVFNGEDGVMLYVDCYNAVGKSIESAVTTAGGINITGKRIAVIGDVEEAGDNSEEMHKRIIQIVDNSSFEYLLTYGPKIKQAADSSSTTNSLKIVSYLNKKELASELKKIVNANDLVLFKASRKSALETIVKQIWPKSYKKEVKALTLAKLKWRLKVIFS